MTRDDVNQATLLPRGLWERTMTEEVSSTLTAESEKGLPFSASRFQISMFFLQQMTRTRIMTGDGIMAGINLENMIE